MSTVPQWAATGLRDWELGRFLRHRTGQARAAYTRAHLLARDCLAQLAGEPVEFAQRCAGCGATDHGAPYVVDRPDLFVSLSHSDGYVAAIAATSRCGIDVQVVRRVPDRALTETERAQATTDLQRSRLWARKEAVIKAGVATMAEIGSIDVTASGLEVNGLELNDWSSPESAAVGAWVVLDSDQ